MLAARLHVQRPFTSLPSAGCAKRPVIVLAASKQSTPNVSGDELQLKSAAPQMEAAPVVKNAASGRRARTRAASADMGAPAEEGSYDRRRGRQRDDDEPKIEQKHFLPLPKPKHLVYIKPTVAVVAAPAPRNSVGLKMTADGKALESYVVEFYQRRL